MMPYVSEVGGMAHWEEVGPEREGDESLNLLSNNIHFLQSHVCVVGVAD